MGDLCYLPMVAHWLRQPSHMVCWCLVYSDWLFFSWKISHSLRPFIQKWEWMRTWRKVCGRQPCSIYPILLFIEMNFSNYKSLTIWTIQASSLLIFEISFQKNINSNGMFNLYVNHSWNLPISSKTLLPLLYPLSMFEQITITTYFKKLF